jgi:hypothetical protein
MRERLWGIALRYVEAWTPMDSLTSSVPLSGCEP